MKKQIFLLVVLLMVCVGVSSAEYYSWEDESGAVHITDYPPPASANARNVQIFDKKIGQVTDAPNKQPEKAPEITLYTKNECPECDKAREFLKSKNLSFTEYNIDKDPAAAEKRKAIDNSMEVPLGVFKTTHVYGFSEAVYNRVIQPAP